MKFGSTRYLKRININSTSFAVTKIKGLFEFDADFFCKHVLNEKTLIDFVFPSHRQSFKDNIEYKNKIKRAAYKVYTTPKYQSRGEFGELIMHVLLRDYYGGIPLIRKIFFKSATNDTVKGYDCVFVVKTESATNIWLGEAKLYESISSVYSKLRASLVSNSNPDYLESEFICLSDHIDDEFEEKAQWENIMSSIKSHEDLKSAFDKVIIPVFVGYETGLYKDSDFYRKLFLEITHIENKIQLDNKDLDLNIVVMLLPINSKEQLIEKLNSILRGF